MKYHIVQIVAENDYECRSYSGRGMNHRTCLAVISSETIGNFIANLMVAVDDFLQDQEDTNMRATYFDDFVSAIRDIKYDSWGKEQTIYYFPSVPYHFADEFSEEDDDDIEEEQV